MKIIIFFWVSRGWDELRGEQKEEKKSNVCHIISHSEF